MSTKRLISSLILAASAAAFSTAAQAESRFVTGSASPLTANANLDFTITIPKFVYVRIGTGTNVADNATIDNLVYTVPAANIGDGTPITGTGGDLNNGQVTARVLGNNGTIAFGSTTLGPLNNGDGDTISWSQIGVNVASLATGSPLPHPALVDGTTTTLNLSPTFGSKVTILDARWTFTYLNQDVVPSGTYGGVNTQNGRVVYAVSMP